MKNVLKEKRATILMNQLHQTHTKQVPIPNLNDLEQPFMQMASTKVISSTNHFLKQGRIEQSKQSKFMKTYCQNKKLAYKCMRKEHMNKLDQNSLQFQRQLYPGRFSEIQFQEKVKALREPVNTGFISAEHPLKVIPPKSHASINEKIQQLQQSLAEFKARSDEQQGRSNFDWKERVILEKCGQDLRCIKESEAWEASFKELMLQNKKNQVN